MAVHWVPSVAFAFKTFKITRCLLGSPLPSSWSLLSNGKFLISLQDISHELMGHSIVRDHSCTYYVIKEEGGWGQKPAIFDDLQYCKSSKMWVGGPKKVKDMMT